MSDKPLLERVHERLGGVGVDIQTFGESQTVEIRWRRDYGEGYGLSDERWAVADNIAAALQAVLDHEDEADAEDDDE